MSKMPPNAPSDPAICPRMAASVAGSSAVSSYGAAIFRSTVGSLIGALGEATAAALGDGGAETVGATVGRGGRLGRGTRAG